MKKFFTIIFLLISLLFLASCGTRKFKSTGPNSSHKKGINIHIPSKEERQRNKEYRKHMRLYRKGKLIEDRDGDGVLDVFDADSVMSREEAMEMDIVEERLLDYAPNYNKENVKTNIKKDKLEIVDNTTGDKDNNSSKGTIAYSVPKEMQVGKSYQIKLRISKQKGKEVNHTLVVGEREIPIADENVDSKVTIENIRVERTMTAELLSEDGAFKVTKLNTDKQVIEDESYTEWGWIVTPQKSGKTYLKLVIKIKIEADGEVSYKDIVVFDKDIEVKANASLEVKGWLSQYWQWLMTTIIIPIVVFFYKKREKRKQDLENKEN